MTPGKEMLSIATRRFTFQILVVGLSILGLAVVFISPAPQPQRPVSLLQSASTPASQPGAANTLELSRIEHSALAESYGKLPLTFEPNRGQTDARVKFVSHGPGYTLFLTSDEAVLRLQPSGEGDRLRTTEKPRADAVLQMKLVGANPAPQIAALDELPGKSNYFIGNDPRLWRTNVPNYAKVRYQQTYPGVDLVYYGNPQQLEYDFVVAPGGDPGVISLDLNSAQINGAASRTPLRIADNGDLIADVQSREVRFIKPVVYQNIAFGLKRFIAGRWVLKSAHEVGFQIASYDHSQPLIIDPALVYCTYLGGSLAQTAYSVSPDTEGNAYVTGGTTSIDFPTVNAYQSANAGQSDVFVTKLNSTGTAFVYSTYLGGDLSDNAFGITVDSTGQAHVTGTTASDNFPVTAGVIQTQCGGGCPTNTRNAFVTVLDAAGSALVYSTYLGGTGADQANGIVLDANSNTYIAGWTTSTDFPTTTGAFQTTYAGTSDTFVAKINPTGTALIYSTLLGTSDDTRAFGIGLDKAGDTYIAGYTDSPGLPTTTGVFQTALAGTQNAFVSKINPTGSGLLYSTYLGGNGSDTAWGIALGTSEDVYVSGQTTSTNFPTTTGALRTTCSTTCSSNDAFVAELNTTGTSLVYSTYLGGLNGEQEAYALAVDGHGNVFTTGRTKSTDFPTTAGAFYIVNQGEFDSFVVELNSKGSGLNYSTYFGGSMTDTGLGIAVDTSDNIYLVGRTFSSNLPVTPGAPEPAFNGNTLAYVAKFIPGVQPWPLAFPYGMQTVKTTSAPMTATLTNSSKTIVENISVAITGTDASDFAISSNTCGTQLAVGASCSVGVTFTPATSGALTAALTFTDTAPNSPQTIPLTGTGTTAAFTLTPASMTFSTQLAGTTSTSQAATLKNIGTTTASITSIVASTGYGQTNNCPANLAANASCVINVVFEPTASGVQKGTLTVTTSVNTPLSVALTGTGTVMSFSPSSVTFGDQTVKTSSSPQAVTVLNVGTAAITITKIGITGSHVTSFSETSNCPISPSTLAAGATCTVNVVFTPQLTGSITANLSLLDTGGGSPQKIVLSGTGD
jgi:hypothetical protein